MRIAVIVVVRPEFVSFFLLWILSGAQQRAGLFRTAHGRFVTGDSLFHGFSSATRNIILPASKDKSIVRLKSTNVLMLESFARYQASQSLILFSFSVRLPPVRVLLRDHVQHVAFLKAYTQLSTRNIRIFLWIVVEMSSYMLYLTRRFTKYLAIWSFVYSGKYLNTRYLVGVFPPIGQIISLTRRSREYEKRKTALHASQNVAHLVHAFPAHFHAIYFQNLVTFVQ